MSTLKEAVKKLSSFDFEKALLKVYKDNDNVIIDLNTGQLGNKSIGSDGKRLVPEYVDLTIAIKSSIGQGLGRINDRVTLYMEGDFHESFFLDTSKFPLFIEASDWKTDILKFKYGDDIFGLTKESIQELKEQLIDEIQTANRKGIGI